MTQLISWDDSGKRFFETGIDRGVLYPVDPDDGSYPEGFAWNGLVSVTESPSGAESNPQYADNIKYLNLLSAEEFGCTIEAFTYPDEFAVCDGTETPVVGVFVGQQPRKPFGLCYRTKVGNDLEGNDHGYKLHLIYGALASPSEKAFNTISESPEAITFSWEVTTTPVNMSGKQAVASLIIDSRTADATALGELEAILYGVAEVIADPDATPAVTGVSAVEGRMPLPDEIVTLMTP